MKDARIWPFKRRAEEDNLITAGACRLILRLASWRYCTKHHPADAEFSLSWRHMAAWYDNEGPETIKNEKTIRRWLRELVLNKYLHYNGRKGCPAQSCFRLDLEYQPEPLTLFNWGAEQASQVVTVSPKMGALVSPKIGAQVRQKTGGPVHQKSGEPVRPKIRAPQYRYSLREEMYPERKKLSGAQRRRLKRKNQVGSLRSKESQGDLMARSARNPEPPLSLCGGNGASTVPPSKKSHVGDKATSPPDDLSTTSRAGAASPPRDAQKKTARPSSRTVSADADDATALHAARHYVASDSTQYLTERHVRALLKAGETIPRVAAEKFAALLEQHNPVPA